MEKVNLLRKAFEGEYETISHIITNRSEKYIALYNQFSEEQDFFMSIISKEHHERFENMMGLIYDMNHEQNYSYYRAGIKLAAEIFLEAFKDEEIWHFMIFTLNNEKYRQIESPNKSGFYSIEIYTAVWYNSVIKIWILRRD